MKCPAFVLFIEVSLLGISIATAQTVKKQASGAAASAAATPATPSPHKSLSELASDARAAKESFKPVPKADVLARQVAAEAAVRRLDRYLKASGANGKGWTAYLHLPELS